MQNNILKTALREPDIQDVLILDQELAELVHNWQRLEVSYATALQVGEKEQVPVAGPLAMALRRNLLMCETFLLHNHDMTMPGYESAWEGFQSKEALVTRIREILSLDARLAEHRRKMNKSKVPGAALFNSVLGKTPGLKRFAKKPEGPASDLSGVVSDIINMSGIQPDEPAPIEPAPGHENGVEKGQPETTDQQSTETPEPTAEQPDGAVADKPSDKPPSKPKGLFGGLLGSRKKASEAPAQETQPDSPQEAVPTKES